MMMMTMMMISKMTMKVIIHIDSLPHVFNWIIGRQKVFLSFIYMVIFRSSGVIDFTFCKSARNCHLTSQWAQIGAEAGGVCNFTNRRLIASAIRAISSREEIATEKAAGWAPIARCRVAIVFILLQWCAPPIALCHVALHCLCCIAHFWIMAKEREFKVVMSGQFRILIFFS